MNVDLNINTEIVEKILKSFIKSELNRVGFEKAVIGLSGGIDSALSCFLAAKALGPENVLAIRMPYETSSPESLEDAQRVIDATGVQSKTIPITPMLEPYFQQFPDMDPLRKGNAMARMRMIILYDHSVSFNGLVIGTGNKTEILLGYTTLYGDSACAINPIGDLYKTQVRQLSAAMGVPKEVITKAPSADLWIGQTDEEELGYTYAEVDKLLYLLIDERYNLEESIEAGFERNMAEKVLKTIQRMQYKRMLPPIAKLSNRTIGYDYLYLRDSWT